MSDESPMPGLDALLSQAMEMQQQMMAAQAEAAGQEVIGASGGGAVEITVTGAMEFREVRIAAEAVDPDDVELLQDLVLAALHDAMAKVNDLQSESLGGFGEMLAGGGLATSGIGGLFGEPAIEAVSLDDDDPEA